AALSIPRDYRFTLRDLWSDSFRHGVPAGRFSFGLAMESARIRHVLWAARFRSLCRDRTGWRDAAAANRRLDQHGKKRGANRGDQPAGAQLGLSPRASRSLLAGLAECAQKRA